MPDCAGDRITLFYILRLAAMPGELPQHNSGRAVRVAALAVFAFTLTRASFAGESRAVVFEQDLARTPLSAEFLRQAEMARSSVPEGIWEIVTRAGWRVRLAEFVVDAAPELKDDHPRGWPPESTWNQTDAINLPRTRTLVLAEKRVRRNGQVVFSGRVEGVLRHELGHAFDMVCGGSYRYGSSTPGFLQAYAQDVQSLEQSRRASMKYYLQSSKAGRQETFAEAFAFVLGGGSDVTRQQEFAESFPAVLEYLRKEISRYTGP